MHGAAEGGRTSVAERAPSPINRPFSIRFQPSSGRLLPHIESFYLYKNSAPEITGVERVDLGQWRFMLEGAGTVTFPDGREEQTMPVVINGPGTAHWTYRIRGPFHCFGISLRGIGWRALVGLPADRVADTLVDAETIYGQDILDLHARLREMETLEEMVAAIEPLLIRRLDATRRVPRPHVAFLRIVREWAAAGDPTIEALYAAMAAETGMGQRQVQRLCKEYFAGPPNHLRRKFRAIGAAMRIYQGASLDEVMGPFADQSHLINEIKHFTGQTPGSLRDGIDPVLAVTLENEKFHFLPDVIPETVDLDGR
ncbi:helix-turn-helix domain-containing protein [Sphingomonas sp. HT-1]|uniref:AraC family transcriptional regulator n=1 Tax=unclassified Sphingomonas TaxID=196159 RepID=UPI0002F05851|nr:MULTISPECIES: helix-turn-helix domain-containing protein [unclassified Sphingomonas]KTF69441.1 AraC family transcriptional regulator [Sphingomonas sp. WG]